MVQEDERVAPPPMLSLAKLLLLLVKLEAGIPRRITRAVLKEYFAASGSLIYALIATLRFLHLIEGEDNSVTPTLERLVEEKTARKQHLEALFYASYTQVLADIGNLSVATHEQLEEAFTRRYHIDNDMRRKAITFFVHLAQEVGITLSPRIRTAETTAFSRTPPQKVHHNGTYHTATPETLVSIREEEETPPSSLQYERQSRTVTFHRGGTLTLSFALDWFALDDHEQTCLLSLIRQMRLFQGEREHIREGEVVQPPLTNSYTFRHGGDVTLSHTFNFFSLNNREQTFVLDLNTLFHHFHEEISVETEQ